MGLKVTPIAAAHEV